jgi:hypothetical protein
MELARVTSVVPKLGRNEPCWCHSGKKYKKCHLTQDDLASRGSKQLRTRLPFDPAQLDRLIAHKDAEEKRRERFQGKGKPIISAEIAGHKIVAVGNTVHWSKTDTTKTFTDF